MAAHHRTVTVDCVGKCLQDDRIWWYCECVVRIMIRGSNKPNSIACHRALKLLSIPISKRQLSISGIHLPIAHPAPCMCSLNMFKGAWLGCTCEKTCLTLALVSRHHSSCCEWVYQQTLTGHTLLPMWSYPFSDFRSKSPYGRDD